MNEPHKQAKLVIISGPSGVGKSTICARLVEALDAFLSVSATTRPQGASEVDGKQYWFLSQDTFEERLAADAFLEHAVVFGHYYGTPREPVDAALAQGRPVILEIDIQGAMQVKKLRPEAVMIFILPPQKDALQQRIDGRGRGEDAVARRRRLDAASHEIAVAWQHYEHLVVNADLDQAVRDVIEIINPQSED